MRMTNMVRAPNLETRADTMPFNPSMIAATEITDVTPMTMPRIVRPLRTLRARKVSSATSRFSLSSPRVMLTSIRPQGRHRVELSRLHRRIDAEKQPDPGAEYDTQHRDPNFDRGGKFGPRAQSE